MVRKLTVGINCVGAYGHAGGGMIVGAARRDESGTDSTRSSAGCGGLRTDRSYSHRLHGGLYHTRPSGDPGTGGVLACAGALLAVTGVLARDHGVGAGRVTAPKSRPSRGHRGIEGEEQTVGSRRQSRLLGQS